MSGYQRPQPYNPAPIGPNFGASIADANSLFQLQQLGEQTERANKLRGILGAPGAIDPTTGMPKTDTISKVMSVDPQVGIKLGENSVLTQQRQLQMQSLRSKASTDQAQLLNDTFAPIVLQHEEAIKSGKVSQEQADIDAQKAWTEAREGLLKGGSVPPEMAQNIPAQWNYQDAKRRAMASDVYLTNVKRQDAQRSEERKERHDEQLNERTGSAIGTDADGKAVFAFPNAPPGKRMQYEDGTPVPPEKQGGFHKVGTGGAGNATLLDQERIKRATQFTYEQTLGHPVTSDEEKAKLDQLILDAEAKQKLASKSASASKVDQDRVANTTRFAYEKELGHPIDPNNPEEKDELDRRTLAAEDKRKTDVAASTSGARSAATQAEKPQSILIDGAPGVGFRHDGKWVDADGAPISGKVLLVNKGSAPGSTAAERATRFQEMKTAQQTAGTYTDDTHVYQQMDRQISEDRDPPISDAAADTAAQIALKTGKPPAWMGRNKASLNKFLEKYADEAKKQGLTADDIAANQVKYASEIAEGRTLGTMSARVDFGAKELDVALPEALSLSEKVYRPGFKKGAEILQALQGQTSDPDLLEFAQQNQQVKSAYAQTMARGGVSTVSAMERADHLLSTATTQTAYMRQLDRLHKEVQTILYGTKAAKDMLTKEIGGAAPETPPPVLTGVPRPGAARPGSFMGTGGAWKDHEIPDSAIQQLRADTKLAPGFDEHFQSPGLAAKILGAKPAPAAQQTPAPAKPAAPAEAPRSAAAKAPANPSEMPDGSIVSQGGKRYRKDGANWVEIK